MDERGLSKMRKVDSFFKETQRFEVGLTPTVTMSDFTLADGSFVPQGTILAFPVYQIHHDDAVFGNPNAFEPF